MRLSAIDRLSAAAVKGGAFTTSEVRRAGVSPRTLYRLCQAGKVACVSRGVYQLVDAPDAISPDFAAIAKRVPAGVVCLRSALHHHGLGTEIPREIDIAISRDANVPRLDYPQVRFFRMSPRPFQAGVGRAVIGGAELRVFSAEKTIADCFKHRRLLGTGTCVEAIRTYMARRNRNPGLVLEMARVCRVEKVVRPCLEALT
jgi:predicted transcriptional regulator of viral defense system